MLRLTIDFLREYFKENDFNLISDEYYNNIELQIECNKCGIKEKVSYKNFKKRARKCKNCFSINQINKMQKCLSNIGYTLLDNKYIGTKKYYNVSCNYGHKYKVTFDNIVKGNKCPKCDMEVRKDKQRLPYEYVKEYIETRGYKLLSKEYISNVSLLKVECPKGHEYDVSYSNFYMGKRCPRCIESKGERRVSEILDNLKINYIKNKRFNDCKYKKPLPFDFYIENLNLIIEYDGIQHFEVRGFGKEEYDLTKIRDKIKNDYCKNKNIKLIRIPYWDFDNIEKIIKKEIEETSTTK